MCRSSFHAVRGWQGVVKQDSIELAPKLCGTEWLLIL